MKRNSTILYGLAILVVFFLAACGADAGLGTTEPEPEHHFWSRACVVVEINDDCVTVEDSVGHLWSFTDDEESWDLGDGCSLLLDDNGTEVIYDDEIVRTDFYRVDLLNDIASKFWG